MRALRSARSRVPRLRCSRSAALRKRERADRRARRKAKSRKKRKTSWARKTKSGQGAPTEPRRADIATRKPCDLLAKAKAKPKSRPRATHGALKNGSYRIPIRRARTSFARLERRTDAAREVGGAGEEEEEEEAADRHFGHERKTQAGESRSQSAQEEISPASRRLYYFAASCEKREAPRLRAAEWRHSPRRGARRVRKPQPKAETQRSD